MYIFRGFKEIKNVIKKRKDNDERNCARNRRKTCKKMQKSRKSGFVSDYQVSIFEICADFDKDV